jgi:hypothetical protein
MQSLCDVAGLTRPTLTLQAVEVSRQVLRKRLCLPRLGHRRCYCSSFVVPYMNEMAPEHLPPFKDGVVLPPSALPVLLDWGLCIYGPSPSASLSVLDNPVATRSSHCLGDGELVR